MKYKIATILCETPLAHIPFVNNWIDDQFHNIEREDFLGGYSTPMTHEERQEWWRSSDLARKLGIKTDNWPKHND